MLKLAKAMTYVEMYTARFLISHVMSTLYDYMFSENTLYKPSLFVCLQCNLVC